MRSNNLLLAAFATAFATAQDLATVLSGQPNLSTLVGLLGQVQNTTEFLASQKNVTLFAPSDDAFASIVSEGGIFSIERTQTRPRQAAQQPWRPCVPHDRSVPCGIVRGCFRSNGRPGRARRTGPPGS